LLVFFKKTLQVPEILQQSEFGMDTMKSQRSFW